VRRSLGNMPAILACCARFAVFLPSWPWA
jgi:hypothetical protein